MFPYTDGWFHADCNQDVFQIYFWKYEQQSDLSSKDSTYFGVTNKKFIEKFRDETNGEMVTESVEERSEIYTYLVDDDEASRLKNGSYIKTCC